MFYICFNPVRKLFEVIFHEDLDFYIHTHTHIYIYIYIYIYGV